MANFSDRLENLTHSIRDLGDELADALPNDLDFNLPDDLDPDPDFDLLYFAIGSSDVLGIGAEPITDGYAFRIEDALENEAGDVQLVLAAVPGANVGPIHDAVQLALRAAPEPDLATVWVGANDLIGGADPEDFALALDQLLDDLEETDALVAIADIPDLTELPRFRDDPDPDVTGVRIAGPSTRRSGRRRRSTAPCWCVCPRCRSRSASSRMPTASIPTISAMSASPSCFSTPSNRNSWRRGKGPPRKWTRSREGGGAF
jgi:hypothetical protein